VRDYAATLAEKERGIMSQKFVAAGAEVYVEE